MQKYLSGFGLIVFVFLIFTHCDHVEEHDEPSLIPVSIENLIEIPPVFPVDEYGFSQRDYRTESSRVQRNESFYLILRRYGISPQKIDRIRREASGFANLSRLRPGQHYNIYLKDEEAVAMVWNINRLEHLVISWENDAIEVARNQFELRTVERSLTGTIQSSLYETLQKDGVSQVLGSKIANIYAWEIDFFTLRNGDSFKVVYDELYVEDDFYAIGDIHVAEFNHRGRSSLAYRFDNGSQSGYFDEEGNSLQRALLKAPFRYNQRVSSGFSHNRFHPILRERRPHHGVDYAAARGTPIIAVGDGVVTEARRRGGNGNIVQIRHNNIYRTAYLHLNGFAPGIRAGARVEQGQVIGYVGRTGLATGYHLCYRMYVNDRPVNSLTVELPVSESLREEYMTDFERKKAGYDRALAAISSRDGDGTFSNVAIAGERNLSAGAHTSGSSAR